jgi:hypothetical protein
VFLVEESSLVSEAEYNKSLTIVQQTVALLDIKENGVNVGVSLYSNNYRKIFDLDYYLTKSSVTKKVSEMERNTNPGQPNIPNALNHSCKNMFLSSAGGRSKAANLLVVLSSSGQTSGTSGELEDAVQLCKDNSVRIISVGENNSSTNTMENIAFHPSYYFTLNDETVAMDISILISDNGGCREGWYCHLVRKFGWLVLWCLTPLIFQQYFSYIVAVSFIGGGNRSTRRNPPTCHKSLTNFIT